VKEIKAYMRPEYLECTICALEEAGARDITVIRVDALGAMASANIERWGQGNKYNAKYSGIAKIEIVCNDDQAFPLMKIIKRLAHTGEPGDGRVFMYPVEYAMNIRTDEDGEAAL